MDGRNEAVWSVIEMEEDGYEEGNDYEEEQDGNEYHDNEEDQNDDNLVTDSDSESDNENNHTGHETNTTRRYENNVTKTILQKGKLSLTVGEAKLYGIINENGELKQRESPNKKLNLKKV